MPRICFVAKVRSARTGKLIKKRISFKTKSHRKGKLPRRIAKFAAKVKAGKVRRNKWGQITSFRR